MTAFSVQRILWFVSLASILALTSCGGCGGKKRSKKSSGATTEEPPVEDPKKDPVKKPDGKVVDNKDVGEEVPPITPDKVATIDTSKGAALKHLILKTTDEQEAGRYLSEFLMVIRANQDSCVRLKVRPTSGLTDELQDDALVNEIEGTGACEGQKIGGDGEDTPAPASGAPAAGAGLWLTGLPSGGVPDSAKRSQGLNLTASTLPLCSSRLFRMESDGLDKVVVKTGRLMPVPANSKVRIWLDEEFANICGADNTFHTPNAVGFAALQTTGALPTQVLDQLTKQHLDNLISEMNKIVAQITATYGSISDIDQSGHIEIFMSPDVNRKYFTHQLANRIDEFQASLIYRPEDLAYYNSETNPTSNEGEILYLWTPDPGGIYTEGEYPSSNSITSNYAKGYLTAQIATMLIANQKLFVHDLKAMEERWVVESIAGILSAYYAGNDYTFPYLTNYLTSRPQYLSLSEQPKAALFSDKFLATAYSEAFGMRTMFGWYMHSKLCGQTVAPCAKLKDLISSKETGKKNVEKVLGIGFNELLENFGLSVGIAMLDKPAVAEKFWDKKPLPADYPPKPTDFPPLAEIFADAANADKRQTVEANNAAVLLGTSGLDRTVAGPFPSKSSLLFQPVASDNDIEFKMAKDSVAYLLVTGLVDPQTDVTAVFGKGLNVVFVPAGERDTEMRRLHVEKLSEQAHGDLRPENLTDTSDPDTTYANQSVYPGLDYSVAGSRELWILGSTDNFEVNEQGTMAAIGDTDAYNVKIEPCSQLSGAAKTTCEATDHQVMAQVIIRDFVKELSPMLVVTKPDRSLFRGHSIYGRVVEINPEFEEPDEQSVATMCIAANSIDTATVTLTAGAPGDVTWAGNTLADGDVISITPTTGTLPRGLEPYRPYTVDADIVTPDTFTLLDNGVPVEIGQRGPHEVRDANDAILVPDATISIGTPAVVTATAHGLADATPIHFSTTGVLPEGIEPGRVYYVKASAANTFEVSTTSGGASVNTTVTISGTYSIHTGSANQCANGGVANAKIYSDLLTRVDDTAYAHTYDNFLMMGRLGFPYTTQNTLTWKDPPDCEGYRCFLSMESKRQHFIFKLKKDEKARAFTYYPAAKGLDIPDDVQVLSAETMSKLASIKRKIDGCQTMDNQSDGFIGECTAVAGLTESECLQVCGSKGSDVQSKVLSYVNSESVAILCKAGADCTDQFTLTSRGSYTQPWFPLNRFYWYGTPVGATTYFYKPIEPKEKTGYCSGEPGNGTTTLRTCDIKQTQMTDNTDIRHQINVPLSKFLNGGCGGKLGTLFDACIDDLSWNRELFAADGYPNVHLIDPLATDRSRVIRNALTQDAMPITARAGELIGKPERIQYATFTVPGTGAVANFIVGGRDQSQGKYLLRVRVKD